MVDDAGAIGADNSACPLPPRPPKRKKETSTREPSQVWDHFQKIKGNTPAEPDPEIAICKYCCKRYGYTGANGTSTLWSHIRYRCKKYSCEKAGNSKNQTKIRFEPNRQKNGGNELKVASFSIEECRLALTEMIVVDELPFNIVERQGFKKFCGVMEPRFYVPSRFTVARDILKLFRKEGELLKKLLKSERVCLTTDTWTSLQNINYMCLTAHWIDCDWNLQKRIIAFCQVENHKGKTIGRVIETCLLNWKIDSLLTVTVDNASSNDGTINYLKSKTNSWKSTIMDNEFMHMRCGAHITNLIVTDGMKEVHESIVKIRNAVRFVRSSPSRLLSFKKCVEKEKIESKSLVCLDIPTRWNSTYLMLEAAQKFQKAFERLEEDDLGFRKYFSVSLSEDEDEDNGGRGRATNIGPPSLIDWENARVFVQFLKIFYEVTLRFSGSLHVTSNAYFNEIMAVRLRLVQLCKSADPMLYIMASNMLKKFEKYWGNVDKLNKLVYIAVVLDPRHKLKYVKFCLRQVNDCGVVKDIIDKVKDHLVRLFEHFEQGGSENSGRSQVSKDNEVEGEESLAAQYQKLLEAEESIESKSEVERYLAESCEDPRKSLDILGWWKVNSSKYPVLSQVARHILAVPVSTVASESAFSTGGRILDPFRSSLNPRMVETLVCTQNWLTCPSSPIDLRQAMDEVEKYEDIFSDKATGSNTSSSSDACASIVIE